MVKMVKLQQIIASQEGLNKLLSTKLPIKSAYAISKLVNKIQPDIKVYDEQRIKLIKELGTQTDPEKDVWSVNPENVAQFQEELTKLQDIDVDLGFGEGKELEKINIADLGDTQIEPNDLLPLEWLLQ